MSWLVLYFKLVILLVGPCYKNALLHSVFKGAGFVRGSCNVRKVTEIRRMKGLVLSIFVFCAVLATGKFILFVIVRFNREIRTVKPPVPSEQSRHTILSLSSSLQAMSSFMAATSKLNWNNFVPSSHWPSVTSTWAHPSFALPGHKLTLWLSCVRCLCVTLSWIPTSPSACDVNVWSLIKFRFSCYRFSLDLSSTSDNTEVFQCQLLSSDTESL